MSAKWIDAMDSDVVETEEDILTFEVADDALERAAVATADGAHDLRDVFGDAGNPDLWVKDVKQHSPNTKVVVLDFFQSYAA